MTLFCFFLLQLDGPIRTSMQGNERSLNRFDNKAAIAMWLHGKTVTQLTHGNERPGNRSAGQLQFQRTPAPAHEGTCDDEGRPGVDDKSDGKKPSGVGELPNSRKSNKRDPKGSASSPLTVDRVLGDQVLKSVQRHIDGLDQRLDSIFDKSNKTNKVLVEKLVDHVSVQLASHDTKIGSLSQAIDKLSTKIGTLETAVRSLADASGRGDLLPKQHCTRQSGLAPDPTGIIPNPSPKKGVPKEKLSKTAKATKAPTKGKGCDSGDLSNSLKQTPKRKTPPPQNRSESSDEGPLERQHDHVGSEGDEERTPTKKLQYDKHASPPSNQGRHWRPPFPVQYPLNRLGMPYDTYGRAQLGQPGPSHHHEYEYPFHSNLPPRGPPVHEMFAQFLEAQAQAGGFHQNDFEQRDYETRQQPKSQSWYGQGKHDKRFDDDRKK